MVSKEGLKCLSEILLMDKYTSKWIGFAEIMKVDDNTFTIKSIDKSLFNEYIVDKKLCENIVVKVRNNE